MCEFPSSPELLDEDSLELDSLLDGGDEDGVLLLLCCGEEDGSLLELGVEEGSLLLGKLLLGKEEISREEDTVDESSL